MQSVPLSLSAQGRGESTGCFQARGVTMDNREEWLARTFVELADTLVADFDLIDFMSALVERCAELLGSAEVGLAWPPPGRAPGHGVVFGAHAFARVDRVPERRRPVPGLPPQRGTGAQPAPRRREARWPGSLQAREAGFEMVHALPLRLRSDVIGAMNIFSSELPELSPEEINLTQALADAATIGILQERAVKHGADLAGQLQGALNSRIVIEQAKGIVAETPTGRHG